MMVLEGHDYGAMHEDFIAHATCVCMRAATFGDTCISLGIMERAHDGHWDWTLIWDMKLEESKANAKEITSNDLTT
jgi:hypothetical protein